MRRRRTLVAWWRDYLELVRLSAEVRGIVMPDTGYRMVERPVYVSAAGNVLPPPKGELPCHMMRVGCESIAVDYDDGRLLPEAPPIPDRYALHYVKFPVSLEVPDSAIPADFALHVACRLVDEGKLP